MPLIIQFAQGNSGTTGEDPECRKHGLRERKDESVDGVGTVLHIVEGGSTDIAVEQDADAARVRVGYHRLAAVVPCWKLDVKPLDAPRLGITTQAAGGTLPIDGGICQTQAAEVITAHFHLPVMPAIRETLIAEHLWKSKQEVMYIKSTSFLLLWYYCVIPVSTQ